MSQLELVQRYKRSSTKGIQDVRQSLSNLRQIMQADDYSDEQVASIEQASKLLMQIESSVRGVNKGDAT